VDSESLLCATGLCSVDSESLLCATICTIVYFVDYACHGDGHGHGIFILATYPEGV